MEPLSCPRRVASGNAAYLQDDHGDGVVVGLIQDAPVADREAPVGGAAQLEGVRRAWVVGQGADFRGALLGAGGVELPQAAELSLTAWCAQTTV